MPGLTEKSGRYIILSALLIGSGGLTAFNYMRVVSTGAGLRERSVIGRQAGRTVREIAMLTRQL